MIEQSEHKVFGVTDCEKEIDKLESRVLRVERDGCPSRLCQSTRVVLGEDDTKKELMVDIEVGHSYSSSLVLPWINGTPELRSFT